MEEYKLPNIIKLEDFGGRFNDFLEAVYDIFKVDFVFSKPVFRGKILNLKRFPIVDGKEYTFYHMTHEGDNENERIPDLRRMERIAWPRPLIDNSLHPYIKVWRNIRRGKGGTKKRILILHEIEKYIVILDDRKDYILPWTAFLIKGSSQLSSYLKEYENYTKTENASQG